MMSLRCNCGGTLQPGIAKSLNALPLAGVSVLLKVAPCLRCQVCGAKALRGDFREAVLADLTRALLQCPGPLHAGTFKSLRKQLRLGAQEPLRGCP